MRYLGQSERGGTPFWLHSLMRTVGAAVCVCAVLLAVGCSPAAGEGDSGKKDADGSSVGGEAVLAAWTIDSDCASCHETEASSVENAQCLYATHVAQDCISCHTDAEGSLLKAHDDYASGKMPKKLKKTDVATDSCLASGCHESEALAAATGEVLVDTRGTAVNPHDLPENGKHGESVTCASCHKMHAEESADPAAMLKASETVCTSCHHAQVFECGTCHEV